MDSFDYQRIAITRPDGGVSIMSIVAGAPIQAFGVPDALAKGFQPSQDGLSWEGGITDDGIVDEIKRSGIDAVSWRRIDIADLPDREFREAWADDGKAIGHDLAKARAIVRDMIRANRATQFAALDATVNRLTLKAALGTITPQDKATLVSTESQRQQLRDAPANPAIDAASDIENLKSILNH